MLLLLQRWFPTLRGGPVKYEKDFVAYFSKAPAFSAGDARRFLVNAGASAAYARLFLHNQSKQKRIIRIGRGMYTLIDDEAVAGFAFRPFYYGMEYAMSLRGLWTQMANPVIITESSAVPGSRLSNGRRVLVRRISKNMFFGYSFVSRSGLFIPVSEPEKILIDFIYYRRSLSREDIARLLKASDMNKLEEYAKRSGRRVAAGLERILNET